MTAEMGFAAGEDPTDGSPARIFLVVSTIYHALLGLLGLVIDQTFPLSTVAAARGNSEFIFGVFETNGWHSVAGLGVAAASFLFVVRPQRAAEGALAIGISQLFVVAAFAFRDPSTFLFASNGADQVIHAMTAVGGIATGTIALMAKRKVDPHPRPPVAA